MHLNNTLIIRYSKCFEYLIHSEGKKNILRAIEHTGLDKTRPVLKEP